MCNQQLNLNPTYQGIILSHITYQLKNQAHLANVLSPNITTLESSHYSSGVRMYFRFIHNYTRSHNVLS